MRGLKFRAWSSANKEYNYKVLVGNSDPKVNEFEVVGNIHQNPELLEEK